MSRLVIGVLILCAVPFIVRPCLSLESNGNVTNLSLEERITFLEQNLTMALRQLDIVAKRTTFVLNRLDELEHVAEKLRNNVTWLLNFALPSPPAGFKVERIRRSREGNFTVTLRWENHPDYEKVNRFVVWRGRKGEGTYADAVTVNRTRRRVMKVELTGFAEGDEMVFKIFAKNDAGQSKPSYAEARIRPCAPILVHRAKTFAAVSLPVIAVVGLLWVGFKRRKSIRP